MAGSEGADVRVRKWIKRVEVCECERVREGEKKERASLCESACVREEERDERDEFRRRWGRLRCSKRRKCEIR